MSDLESSANEPRIALCPHGCVHLHLGAVTLLLNHASLRALADAATACLADIDGAARDREPESFH